VPPHRQLVTLIVQARLQLGHALFQLSLRAASKRRSATSRASDAVRSRGLTARSATGRSLSLASADSAITWSRRACVVCSSLRNWAFSLANAWGKRKERESKQRVPKAAPTRANAQPEARPPGPGRRRRARPAARHWLASLWPTPSGRESPRMYGDGATSPCRAMVASAVDRSASVSRSRSAQPASPRWIGLSRGARERARSTHLRQLRAQRHRLTAQPLGSRKALALLAASTRACRARERTPCALVSRRRTRPRKASLSCQARGRCQGGSIDPAAGGHLAPADIDLPERLARLVAEARQGLQLRGRRVRPARLRHGPVHDRTSPLSDVTSRFRSSSFTSIARFCCWRMVTSVSCETRGPARAVSARQDHGRASRADASDHLHRRLRGRLFLSLALAALWWAAARSAAPAARGRAWREPMILPWPQHTRPAVTAQDKFSRKVWYIQWRQGVRALIRGSPVSTRG
jgi:hypothetical protein